MDYTEKAYINLISACINETDSIHIDYDKVDLQKLIMLCKIHRNAGVVFLGIKRTKNAPEKFLNIFEQGFYTELMLHAKRAAAWNSIRENFKKAGIECIIIKGQSIAVLYPAEELRTMSDIDLVVKKEKFAESHKIMKEMGAEFFYEKSDRATNVYKYNNANIEIHCAIASGENLSGRYDFEQYFSSCFENVNATDEFIYTFTPEYQMIYVMYHMAKHFYNNGCGIRMLTDMAVMINEYGEDLDWKKVKSELEKIGLGKFSEKIFAICHRLFLTEVPDVDYTFEKMEEIAQTILSGGIFGYENVSSDTGRIRKNKSENYYMSMLKWALPSYKKMRDHSEWFKDKPAFLLPVAYIERFLRNAKERGGGISWMKSIRKGRSESSRHDEILKIMELE